MDPHRDAPPAARWWYRGPADVRVHPLFALGVIVVLVLGVSSLHLLWWFPVTFVLGIVMLMFPAGVHFTMTCLALLAGPKSGHDSQH